MTDNLIIHSLFAYDKNEFEDEYSHIPFLVTFILNNDYGLFNCANNNRFNEIIYKVI